MDEGMAAILRRIRGALPHSLLISEGLPLRCSTTILKGGAFIMKKIPVTILAYAGVLVAMNILLSRVFTINLGNSIRINFSAAPVFLAGIWFGPFIGGLTGIAADLMGCVVSGYAPFPLITVSTCLWGVIPGLMSGFLRTKKTDTVLYSITSYLRVVFILGITMAITSQGITTFALSEAYGTPFNVLFLSRQIGRAHV